MYKKNIYSNNRNIVKYFLVKRKFLISAVYENNYLETKTWLQLYLMHLYLKHGLKCISHSLFLKCETDAFADLFLNLRTSLQ